MYSGYGQAPKIRFEVIGEAWQLFTQQMGTWVMAVLLMFVVLMVPAAVMFFSMFGMLMASLAGGRNGAPIFGVGMMLGFPVAIMLLMVLAFVLMGGLYRMAIKQVRGEPIQLSDVWSVTDVLVNLLGGGLLVAFATMVGAVLCYLPALIVGGLLMLTIPLIVDQKMSPIEAATRSWNALKSEWLMAGVLFFVLSFIGGLGAIAVYIGMLFTYPIFILGVALVYRDFILGPGGPPPPGSGSPYPVGVTPGSYPPAPYVAEPPPPGELR